MDPELGAFWGIPGRPPGGVPRVHKKCTFFWVFNNSPSRDSLAAFFGLPRTPHFWPILGVMPRVGDG